MVLADISLPEIRRVFPGNTPVKDRLQVLVRGCHAGITANRRYQERSYYGKGRNEKENQVRVCGCV